jgi:hypothetical protein
MDDDDPYGEEADGGNPFGFSAAPQGASTLASLFGGGASAGGGGDLSYKPPPKPKPAPRPAAPPPAAGGAAQPKASILLSLRAREVYRM